MGYVMVPVPEEHADEIGQLVLSLTLRQKLNTWPPGAAAALVERIDPTERALLRFVTFAGKVWLDVAEVVAATGLDHAEVLRRSEAINAQCGEVGAPYVLLIRDDGDGQHSVLVSAQPRAELKVLLGDPDPGAAAPTETPATEEPR